MDRTERLLIQGSSWTVGAYEKSTTPMVDKLVPGGLADLFSQYYQVTNISVQDDFNLGSVCRLQEHLAAHSSYDKLLVCQNDPLRDLTILRSTDAAWSRQFDLNIEQIVDQRIDSIGKLIEFLLDKFYLGLSKFKLNTYVFAGPSSVHRVLAEKYGINVIQPCWTSTLVPTFSSSFLETSSELVYATEILINLFPKNQQTIKKEMIEYSDHIAKLLRVWDTHSEYFAYHHPTMLGNNLFFEHIRNL
jgi:hypothetical protein